MYTIVFIFYAQSLLLMLLFRPALLHLRFKSLSGASTAVYVAMYFLPLYIFLQAVIGGLLCKFQCLLYTIVFIFYAQSLLLMLLFRPALLHLRFKSLSGASTAVYVAMYFLPLYIFLQAVIGGLLYYSFPYIIIVLALVSNAVHFSCKLDQSMHYLVKSSATNLRNVLIIGGNMCFLAYGIVSLTLLENPVIYGPLLGLVPLPTIFYILTARFTEPGKLNILQALTLPEPSYQGPDQVIYFSGPNLEEEISGDTKITWLVAFYAAWSPPCVQFAPLFAKLSAEYGLDNLKFGKLDVTRYPEVAKKHYVNDASYSRQLPTVILYRNGKEAIRRPMVDSKGHDHHTVTAEWYIKVCLPAVLAEVKQMHPKTGLRGLLLHHNNVPAHTAVRTLDFLVEQGMLDVLAGAEAVAKASHPKHDGGKKYLYGTAGFRMSALDLDFIMYRMGLLAVLRSRKLDGATVGVMVTASHNPEEDNGEMLAPSWEELATALVAIPDSHLASYLREIVVSEGIGMEGSCHVLVGRDTRESSPRLSAAVEDGIAALKGSCLDFGVVTTPQLHYFVVCQNSGISLEPISLYEDLYMKKLAGAFNSLMTGLSGNHYDKKVICDCANGVGALKMKELAPKISSFLTIEIRNAGEGRLNHSCGADFVKVQHRAPVGISAEHTGRCVSIDGDADRVVYFYHDNDGKFHLLDGDKIATLIAAYLKELINDCGLSLRLGLVQTAYANGSSTIYIQEKLGVPVSCVPTGVKYLHHKALEYDIGVYFEANGHGTVVFSKEAEAQILSAAEKSTGPGIEAATRLRNSLELINQSVGDALSDFLLVETILAFKDWSPSDWDAAYTDLPSQQVKVHVADRTVITTTDAERKCVTPDGLQSAITEVANRHGKLARAFVRPSGTEDVVRVYAEASTWSEAKELANEVAALVHHMAGGVIKNFKRNYQDWVGWIEVPAGGPKTRKEPVRRFTIVNHSGLTLQTITYGATLTSLQVPDRDGELEDVVLGYDTFQAYIFDTRYFGCTVGRFTNRIANGRFRLGDRLYQLPMNDGPNHLHGGPRGFHKQLWSSHVEGDSVLFSYLSQDGEEGYPGEVMCHVMYHLTAANEVVISYKATSTKPTPVNLTNHSYFNLAGHNAGSSALYEHEVWLNADSYTPVNENGIPLGTREAVANTPFDFKVPRKLGDVLPEAGGGFDHNFCIIGGSENSGTSGDRMNRVAKVTHAPSGRVMEVLSTQPGVQFYTGNFLPETGDDSCQGKGDAIYHKHGGLCLEAQNFPDAMNHASFPNCILAPGSVTLDSRAAFRVIKVEMELEEISTEKCFDGFQKVFKHQRTLDPRAAFRVIKVEMELEEISTEKCFGGFQKVFKHQSTELKCQMAFAVYLPPAYESEPVPVLYYLSGLTCTEQNFIQKAGVQQHASKYGVLIVSPDTSPPALNVSWISDVAQIEILGGCDIPGEDDSWDFGSGAGFYVDATEEKWKYNYRMYSYITKELPALIRKHFKVGEKQGIFGHSMGGHGALICSLKNPGMYASVSAFAPICNPTMCAWGKKAFSGYLGENEEVWKEYDACHLIRKYSGPPLEILIDQGTEDAFLKDKQLLPENFVTSCNEAGLKSTSVILRMQEGYTHSYYFIASFMGDHISHHAKQEFEITHEKGNFGHWEYGARYVESLPYFGTNIGYVHFVVKPSGQHQFLISANHTNCVFHELYCNLMFVSMRSQLLSLLQRWNPPRIPLHMARRHQSTADLGGDENPLVVTEKMENVTLIGINRPQKRNCVNVPTARALRDAFHAFEEDNEAYVAVLYGKGGTFCAGYDLSDVASAASNEEVQNAVVDPSEGPMGPSRWLISKPVIGAIEGYAVAGGLELALLCDMRVVEENAVMGVFCRRFGVPLLDGGTVRLPAVVGFARAMDLILTGRPIRAKEAFEWGLANRLVATGTALGQAVQLAKSLVKFPQDCLKADRRSAYYATFDAKDLKDAFRNEIFYGRHILTKASFFTLSSEWSWSNEVSTMWKIIKTLRTHWKKSIFFASVAFYGGNYVRKQLNQNAFMRQLCEEALQYGNLPQPVGSKSRHITVILNPVARGGKSQNLFDKYCAPLLYLAGIRVSLIRTEAEGQARDIMEVMDNTDAILVAGGDGTVSEVLTGLLRRQDTTHAARRFPIGIAPLGRTNQLVSRLVGHPSGSVEQMAEATMETIRQIHHPANVLQVSPIASEEKEGDKETSSRPICAMNQVAVGPFLDVDAKIKSLWYFGPFAKHVAYVWATLKSSPWFMEWKGLYQNPCKGCRRCQDQEKKGGSHEEGSGTSRWWHAFVRPTRDHLKSTQKAVEQDIINPDCGTWHDISLQSVFLEVRPSDPAMEMCYIPAQISRWSFIHLGMDPDDRRDVSLTTMTWDFGNLDDKSSAVDSRSHRAYLLLSR
ncbi:unnamed protein product, partial [Darwinula stevensoni]